MIIIIRSITLIIDMINVEEEGVFWISEKARTMLVLFPGGEELAKRG